MNLKLFGFFTGLLSLARCRDLTLQTVTGSLPADNFTYYTLSYDGPISLILDSVEGDADLYISQHLLHPSYNLSEYCLHSASCGQDRVDIPTSFKRPIGVAVYSHILHPTTIYTLTVVLRDETAKEVSDDYDNILDDDVEIFDANKKKSGDIGTGAHKIPQGDEQSIFSSMLWTFLEILLEVLFA